MTEKFKNVRKFPEWKELYAALLPLIEEGKKEFTYEQLDQLAGIDIRSTRGRGQFYKARHELLKEKLLWMEVMSNIGYTVIPAQDHRKSAMRRVSAARRRIGVARAITSHTDIEKLGGDERLLHAATAAVLHDLAKTFRSVSHKFSVAQQRLETGLPELMKSIAAAAETRAKNRKSKMAKAGESDSK